MAVCEETKEPFGITVDPRQDGCMMNHACCQILNGNILKPMV